MSSLTTFVQARIEEAEASSHCDDGVYEWLDSHAREAIGAVWESHRQSVAHLIPEADFGANRCYEQRAKARTELLRFARFFSDHPEFRDEWLPVSKSSV